MNEPAMKAPLAETNDPAKAGQPASCPVFLNFSRYKVQAIHTRFDAVRWFVSDAEEIDCETGLPAVIRQEPSFDAAIQGLEDEDED